MSDHGEKDEEEELRKQTEIIRQAKTALESKSDLTPAETLSQLLTIITLWDEKFEHLDERFKYLEISNRKSKRIRERTRRRRSQY